MSAVTLTWSDSFAVGHPVLDRQHRRLLKSINIISSSNSMLQQMQSRLKVLRKIAKEHFKSEDSILLGITADAVSNPHYAAAVMALGREIIIDHIEEHEHSLAVLDSIMQGTFPHTGQSCQNLSLALPHWFVNHAVKHDAHLKTLFQAIESDCPGLLEREAERRRVEVDPARDARFRDDQNGSAAC